MSPFYYQMWADWVHYNIVNSVHPALVSACYFNVFLLIRASQLSVRLRLIQKQSLCVAVFRIDMEHEFDTVVKGHSFHAPQNPTTPTNLILRKVYVSLCTAMQAYKELPAVDKDKEHQNIF